ncbi:MAG: response regulator [Thermodesulfobacteriota bacterium]
MKNVLLIEDEPVQRKVVKGLLEDKGLKVVGMSDNGNDAVRLCKEIGPDLVLMDVSIPGKDGIEATMEINSLCPTPVVLVTGNDDDETIRRAVDAGVMAYLIKPVKGEELYAAIELAVSRFKEFKRLIDENKDLHDTLAARKIIEKAKGLLIEKEGITEREAFTRIRKISMDKRKSMKEIAEVIISAMGLD